MAMSSYDKRSVETLETMRQSDPVLQALFGQQAANARAVGTAEAARVAEVELAKSKAIDNVNAFAAEVGFDSLAAVTNDYLETSRQSRELHKAASQQLDQLNKQASTSIFDNPLTWLGNQITFEDDFKAAQVAVQAANSKSEETAALKDQILTLNNAVQEKSASETALAKTSSINTAQYASEMAKRNAENLALQAEIEGVKAGTDIKIKSLAVERDAEEMRMSRERLRMEKERMARALKEEQNDQASIKQMWDWAALGLVKTRGISMEEAKATLGAAPTSRTMLKFMLDSNTQLDAATRVGASSIIGDDKPYGESLEQVGMTLTTLQARGRGQSAPVTDFVKNIFTRGAALELDPKKKTVVGAQEVANALKVAASRPINSGTPEQTEQNPLHLQSPAVAMAIAQGRSDPQMQKLLDDLKQHRLVQALATNKTLESRDPAVVLQAAAAQAKSLGISPTEAAKVYAKLYEVSGQLQKAYLAEHALDIGAVDSIKYLSPNKGFFTQGSFRPMNAADVQKELVTLQHEEAMKGRWQSGGNWR